MICGGQAKVGDGDSHFNLRCSLMISPSGFIHHCYEFFLYIHSILGISFEWLNYSR